MFTTRLTLAPLLAGIGLLGTAGLAQAQAFHMLATPEKGIWLEAGYADVKGLDQSFPSTFWFVSGRTPLSSRARLVVDLPLSYFRVRIGGGLKDSNGVLGNPFLGVELPFRSVVVEAGMRVPVNTIDEDTFADVLGVLGDFQRAEAFIDDVVPLSVAVTYEHGLARGASLRGRVGLVGIISTVGGVPDDALVDYGMLGTHPIGSARLGLGLYGRWDASEDQGSFGQNSVHHLALSADLGVRRVRPGLAVRVPVDGFYNDVLKSTISAYLQIPLN